METLMHIDASLRALAVISTWPSLIPTLEFIWIVTRQVKGYQSAISEPKSFWDVGAQWWKLCYTLPDQWIYCLTGLFSAQCHWKCRHWSLAKRAIHHLVQDIGAKIMYCTLDKKIHFQAWFKNVILAPWWWTDRVFQEWILFKRNAHQEWFTSLPGTSWV